jgi:hypothetical protein
MKLTPELEGTLKEYRREIENIDLNLPSFFLENIPPDLSKSLTARIEIVDLPDLSEEIDRMWEDLESRRISGEPSKSLWNVSAAALAGLAIGGLSVFVYRTEPPSDPLSVEDEVPVSTVPFPSGAPLGLSVSKGAFLSFDESTNQLVALDPGSSRVVTNSPFPKHNIAAVSVSDRAVLSLDSVDNWIYRHDPGSLSLLEKYPAPGWRPSAIYQDGNHAWVSDAKKIYGLAVNEAFRETESRISGVQQPVGIVRVGDWLWVADAENSQIARFQISKGLKPRGRASISHLVPAEARISGIAVSSGWLWIVTDGPSELHRIPIKRISFPN